MLRRPCLHSVQGSGDVEVEVELVVVVCVCACAHVHAHMSTSVERVETEADTTGVFGLCCFKVSSCFLSLDKEDAVFFPGLDIRDINRQQVSSTWHMDFPSPVPLLLLFPHLTS